MFPGNDNNIFIAEESLVPDFIILSGGVCKTYIDDTVQDRSNRISGRFNDNLYVDSGVLNIEPLQNLREPMVTGIAFGADP
jgi:hypothetical protein